MARYFFHLRDGEDLLLDPDGRELPHIEAVAAAALREAREIIGHDAREGHIKLTYHLDVQDGGGQLVHRLQFKDAVVVMRAPETLNDVVPSCSSNPARAVNHAIEEPDPAPQ